MAKVLVVGGAGYVGSSCCAWLTDANHEVWVLDDLSTGHAEFLLGDNLSIAGFTLGKCGDSELLSKLLAQQRFDCVMHFAAKTLVGESVKRPEEYHENNVVQSQRLVHAILDAGIRNFIFSSSCAIFGDSGGAVIHENLPKSPLNPYGQNKLDFERFLESQAKMRGLRSIALRYFNAAGAEPRLRVGEWHETETHLIPRVLQAAQSGGDVEVFGTDYSTKDGTCIRDYVHVWDLAQAHAKAMERLLTMDSGREGVFEAYNLGSEKGFSVREVIRTCEEVTGKKLNVVERARREGDPPFLVADSAQAKRVLNFGNFGDFDKKHSGLKAIVSSAWEWEKKRAQILRKAVFLDRDGTINEDPGYLSRPDQLKLLPGVGEGLRTLKEAGFLLVVVSNQSGVGRGLIDPKSLVLIHQKLDELLAPFSVNISRYELCLHRPDENCECRKPKSKLLVDASRVLQIDLSSSYMMGDKQTDLEAGWSAGCRGSVLLRTGEGRLAEATLPHGKAAFVAESILDASRWIIADAKGPPSRSAANSRTLSPKNGGF